MVIAATLLRVDPFDRFHCTAHLQLVLGIETHMYYTSQFLNSYISPMHSIWIQSTAMRQGHVVSIEYCGLTIELPVNLV